MVPTAKPHGGAYEAFPDGPESYREAAWDTTLKRLFTSAVVHAEDRVAWYDAKGTACARVAKRIRSWSLLLFAIGTLAPILLTFLVKFAAVVGAGTSNKEAWTPIDWLASVPLAEIGYVLLAVAGALVIFDQFFDSSGSWIRFRQSQARLEVLLAELRYSWAELMTKSGGAVLERQQAVEFVALLRAFVTKVEMLAEEETRDWARRFNKRIDAFDRNPNLKVSLEDGEPEEDETVGPAKGAGSPAGAPAGAPRKGGAPSAIASKLTVRVNLAVDDADQLDAGSLELTVNDAPVSIPADGMIELPLEVGIVHRVVASGRRKGKPVRGAIDLTPTLDDEGKALAVELA